MSSADASAPWIRIGRTVGFYTRWPVPIPMQLHNTLGRAVEQLKPLRSGEVSIYSCGPTVYRYAHVGNLRTYIFSDLLRRSLEYLGLRTRQVMNITDVGHLTEDDFDRGEDKMLVSARLENKSPEEIAEFYTAAFLEDIRKVNIRPADEYPRATAYIPQMQGLIERLIERGHAYRAGGNVYYDIASFPEYGKLSGNSVDKLLAGARMAKSAGNFFRITEIEEMGHDPLAFRYLALQARYRAKLNFGLEGLAGADRALRLLRGRVAAWSAEPAAGADGGEAYAERFRSALADDLDLPAAMALVAEVGRAPIPGALKARLLLDFDRVLGLDLDRDLGERALPAGAAELLRRRERARAERDYATSDQLRHELAEMGVQVTDSADGQLWKTT